MKNFLIRPELIVICPFIILLSLIGCLSVLDSEKREDYIRDRFVRECAQHRTLSECREDAEIMYPRGM